MPDARVQQGLVDIEDPEKHRPLLGGIIIVGEDSTGEGGTLGCIGLTSGTPPGVVALTNAHILYPNSNTSKTGALVGQPGLSSICAKCCGNPIGRVLKAFQTTTLDCALVQLDSSLEKGLQFQRGIRFFNTTKKVWMALPVKGVHTVLDSEVKNPDGKLAGYLVLKRGVATDLTSGIIVGLNQSAPVLQQNNSFTTMTGLIKILSAKPGEPFSKEGDSGAVVFNKDNEIVGLLVAGGTSQSLAIPIQTVIDAFKDFSFQIATTSDAVPAIEPVPALSHSVALPEGSEVGTVPPSLIRAHEQLVGVSGGRALVDAFHRHQREVMRLVNTNRRVATVWHRSDGPKIFQTFLQAAQKPEEPAPTEVNGRMVRSDLEQIGAIFLKYASDALRADIQTWAQSLLRAPGLSFSQFVAELRDFEPHYAG